MTQEQLTSELENIAVWATGLKQQATSLIDKLGQFSAPVSIKKLSPDQLGKLKSNRLKIILKNQRMKKLHPQK